MTSMNEWKDSGVQKIIQIRNLGQFQVCLLSIGIKEILKISYKIKRSSSITKYIKIAR